MLVCLLFTAAAGLPVYVRPQIDQLRDADAILILNGPYHRRHPFGFDLAGQGWTPTWWFRTRAGQLTRS
jgi:hypothetical protein